MSPRTASRSVRRKLFAGVLLTTLAALLTCGAGLFAYDLHAYRETSANSLAVEAELVGHETSAALQFDDRASAAQNIAFLKARPHIRVAALYTPDGSLFASYAREGARHSEIPRAPGAEGVAIHGDTVAVFHRIKLNNEVIGSIYLAEDLKMYDRVWSYTAIMLAVILIALLVSAVLSTWLQRSITRPIIEISTLARDVVERRDYAVRAKRTTHDETGTLVDAFNEMLSEIQRRTDALVSSNAEVHRLNKDLERRVLERTAELEESNLRLKSASLAKSNFLSMMSHEIRTPMNGVLGMLEILSLSALDAQQRTTLNVIQDSGRSLLRIIDDILDFSKIEAGKLEIRPEVASIARLIESVSRIYSGNASSKALLLKSYCDPRISPAVLVDPLRLQQILNNLVSNAIKFTSQGFVELKAELVERSEGKDLVRFSVTDTGIGISREGRAALFQPFSQGGQDITRMFGGTGLGLSIGQRLATMMGGTIAVTSELGEGTTACLSLPLPVADAALLPSADGNMAEAIADIVLSRRNPPTPEEARAEGSLVLIVDDHPVNRLVLKRQVTALGYASEEAADGREGFEKWRTGHFPLIITDCNMPGMDGYELARAIRAAERQGAGPATIIIACTANALKGEADNCFAAGMNDYIAKPVQLSKLLEKFNIWLPIASTLIDKTGASPDLDDSVADSPLDATVLAEATGGDADLVREALGQFKRFNAGDVAELLGALERRDLHQAMHSAHRIKGACRTLGAMRLAMGAERIELAAGAADWAAVEAGRQFFNTELERLNGHIDRALAAAPTSMVKTNVPSRQQAK